MTKPSSLDHQAFFRLSGADRAALLSAAELWEAEAGSVIRHPGDPGDDLLYLIDGRLANIAPDGAESRILPGDLLGDDDLADPRPVDATLRTLEASRWLRWSSEVLTRLLAVPSIRRGLAPLRGSDGTVISGFAGPLPVESPGSDGGRRYRCSLKPLLPAAGFTALVAGSLVLAVARNPALPPVLPLAAPAVFLGWLLLFLLGRLTTVYTVSGTGIRNRRFDWSRFSIESRRVPPDRIRGVEVEKKGLLQRILGYGTVFVKTSAIDGELVLRDVDRPEHLARELNTMREGAVRRDEGRDREMMRRALESRGFGGASPRLVEPSRIPGEAARRSAPEALVFRKSPAVLLGRLIPPLLIGAVPILAILFFGDAVSRFRIPILSVLVPAALWALYRIEDWRNDRFEVSGRYVVDLYRKPLGLKENRRQVELVSVQNIRTEQKGPASFIFRFGDVILVTAGGASDTVFENVSRPWKVQERLFACRERELRRMESLRQSERRDDMIRFAEVMDQIRSAGPGR